MRYPAKIMGHAHWFIEVVLTIHKICHASFIVYEPSDSTEVDKSDVCPWALASILSTPFIPGPIFSNFGDSESFIAVCCFSGADYPLPDCNDASMIERRGALLSSSHVPFIPRVSTTHQKSSSPSSLPRKISNPDSPMSHLRYPSFLLVFAAS